MNFVGRNMLLLLLVVLLAGFSGYYYNRTVNVEEELKIALASTLGMGVNHNIGLLQIYFQDGSEEASVGPDRLEPMMIRLHSLDRALEPVHTYRRITGDTAPVLYATSITQSFTFAIRQCISQRIDATSIPWTTVEQDRTLLAHYANTFSHLQELRREFMPENNWREDFYSPDAPWIRFLAAWAELAEEYDWEACMTS